MNEIVNKFLLVRDKFIPEVHLRQCLWTIQKKHKQGKSLKKHEIYDIFIKTN